MPDHDSWWSLLPFHESFRQWAAVFGKPVNEDGTTWIAHQQPDVQHIYAALFVLAILVFIAVATAGSIRSAGKDLLPHDRLTLRNFAELIVGGAYSMMTDMMGAKAARHFLPLIGTCAFFILLSNALGLIPGFLPPTSNLNTTLALGVVVFITTHIYGLKVNGLNHVKHFFGPIISWKALPLMLLMFPIELISNFVRPLSLGIRLMANMMADHLVLTIFVGFIVLMPTGLIWVPIPLPMYLLGTIVVLVQTLVFCLLSTVYIAMAIEPADHH